MTGRCNCCSLLVSVSELGGREALMVSVKYPSLFYEGPSDQSKWRRLEEYEKKAFKCFLFSKEG